MGISKLRYYFLFYKVINFLTKYITSYGVQIPFLCSVKTMFNVEYTNKREMSIRIQNIFSKFIFRKYSIHRFHLYRKEQM